MSELDAATKDWHKEVDEETIKLIERGTRPEGARIDAMNIISDKRKRKNADKSRG